MCCLVECALVRCTLPIENATFTECTHRSLGLAWLGVWCVCVRFAMLYVRDVRVCRSITSQMAYAPKTRWFGLGANEANEK